MNGNLAEHTHTELWKFYNAVTCDVRQLESLQVTTAQYGVCLAPIVLSRLPEELRLEWARTGEGHEDDLNHLLTFLKTEIGRKERAVINVNNTTGSMSITKPKTVQGSAAALISLNKTQKCDVCNKSNHKTSSCFKLRKGPISSRWHAAKCANLCFCCLSAGHSAGSGQCGRSCGKCGGQHHDALCHGNGAQGTNP